MELDLHQEQDDAVKRRLKEACLEYSFLLVRGQDITLDEQLRFGRIFGDVLEDGSSARKGSFVTSVGELCLHFDHWLISNFPQPIHFTMLYGMKVVPVGGETLFANARTAYQRLPESLKAQIKNMQAVHCYNYSYASSEKIALRIREADIPPDQPRATHPVVRVHPGTGEKTLYVSPRNTQRILGLEPGESEALLQELWTYIENPDSGYAHKWHVGDLLLWDNHALLHGRRDFDSRYERRLRRMCIL
jgi:taurine dioxygenase